MQQTVQAARRQRRTPFLALDDSCLGLDLYTSLFACCSVLRVSLLHLLPRDAMRKRGLCCRPVSVRLSVCHVVDCIQMDISKLLSRPSSPIILVF